MSREITIALAQTAPVLNNNEENLRRMGALIQRICGDQPTNLIVFPELALSGYECGLNFTRLAERIEGHAVAFLAGKAAEMQCSRGLWDAGQGEGREHSLQYRHPDWPRR